MKSRIIALLSIILCFTSCQKETQFMNYNSEKYITLYDYNSIYVEESFTKISNQEIIDIIETEMSVNEAYIAISSRKNIENDDIALLSINGNLEYYYVGSEAYSTFFEQKVKEMVVNETKNITSSEYGVLEVKLLGIYRTANINDIDFILSYYDFTSFDELRKFISNRASEEIIFNYAYDVLFQNSLLKCFPAEIEKQIKYIEAKYKEEVLQYYSSFEEYLLESEMTEKDFIEDIYSKYYEVVLYKAILDKENITLTSEDIAKYKIKNNLDEYNDYEIYKEIAYPFVRDVLISSTTILKK